MWLRNYNRIYRGRDGHLLLVRTNGSNQVAVVESDPTPDGRSGEWNVISADLQRGAYLAKEKLLWEAARTSDLSNPLRRSGQSYTGISSDDHAFKSVRESVPRRTKKSTDTLDTLLAGRLAPRLKANAGGTIDSSSNQPRDQMTSRPPRETVDDISHDDDALKSVRKGQSPRCVGRRASISDDLAARMLNPQAEHDAGTSEPRGSLGVPTEVEKADSPILGEAPTPDDISPDDGTLKSVGDSITVAIATGTRWEGSWMTRCDPRILTWRRAGYDP
jgi:hypothetical protein